MFSKTAFDDEIAIGNIIQRQRRRQQPHALVDLLGGHPTALGAALVVAPHDAETTVERFLARLDDGHRCSGVEEVHRDTATHRPSPDNADLVNRNLRRVLGNIGNLAGGALGEEVVALRRGLVAVHQLVEALALDPKGLVERLRHRVLDAADDRLGGVEAARLASDRFTEPVEELRILSGVFEPVVEVAYQRQLSARLDDLAGERQAAFHNVVDDLVDEPVLEREVGAYHAARDHHLQGAFHSHQARQPLRAAGPRDQPEMHFRLAEPRAGHRHSVVAAHRGFQPATERSAVDR